MQRRRLLAGMGGLGLAAAARPSLAAGMAAAAMRPTVPLCDHHQHLLSPAGAALLAETPPDAVTPPPDVAAVLKAHEDHWNDKAAIADLYTEDAALLNHDTHSWIKGRGAVAGYVATRFARPYRITPVAVQARPDAASVAAFLTRGEAGAASHFGAVQLSLVRGNDGVWRIAAESPTFPGPDVTEPLDAARLIGLLDEPGIGRAVVLSTAYWFSSPFLPAVADELGKTRAENDWTADQCAAYPDRLTAFCSVNPLKDHALAELDRCARSGRFSGLKLHFGNSGVDARKPDHVARLRTVFAAANAHRFGIVAHLWTQDPGYGAPEAQSFLSNLLPAAPDVAVQVAHMAGGGPGWTDPALKVFAEAVAAGDPRTRRLFFDVATVADGQSWSDLKLLAARIRQIGLGRVLYGSDAAFGGRATPRAEWGVFRGMVPLGDDEFKVIAGNVAPYAAGASGAQGGRT